MTAGERVGRLGDCFGLDRAETLHGLRLAFAAFLALTIALALHTQNPYWAAMPVWVVSQSTKGLMIEKAAFRLLGTVLGAAVGFGLVRLGLGAEPTLVMLCSWIALNAFLSHMLRGLHGYGAVLAGMTAGVVALPAVIDPAHAAVLAAARVECTLIGAVCITLVTMPWTPHAMRQAFYERVHRLVGQARQAASAHDGTLSSEVSCALMWDMTELQAEAALVSAGSIEGYRRLRHVDALIVACLAVLAETQAMVWRRHDAPVSDGAEDLDPPNRLASALDDLNRAELAFADEGQGADARPFRPKVIHLSPHHDTLLALEGAAISGLGTFAVALLAVRSGWRAGELTALGVCIFSMALGSLPGRRALAPSMLKGVSIGVVAALIYRLVVQPHVATASALLLSMAPWLLVAGLARASRKTRGPALDGVMCFLLGSQAGLPPAMDRGAIMSGAAALMLAVVIVTTTFMVIPSGPDRRARNAARAIRRDLVRMARLPSSADLPPLRARMARQVLRLSFQVLRQVGPAHGPDTTPLAALALGNAIARLVAQRDSDLVDAPGHQVIVDALGSFGDLNGDTVNLAESLERLARSIPAQTRVKLLLETAAALRAAGPLLSNVDGRQDVVEYNQHRATAALVELPKSIPTRMRLYLTTGNVSSVKPAMPDPPPGHGR